MFFCFSSGDRYTAVKSCLYHLKNYGIPVWYDYHELILGDAKREKNFEYAIKTNRYFLIIYSTHFFNSPCALEEEKRIFDELSLRDIVIFPLLYNIKFNDLPTPYKNKLENYIYNEIDDKSGTVSSINQIVTKILIDKINNTSFDLTPSLSTYNNSCVSDKYIVNLLDAYNKLANENFNARIAILFCLSEYIKSHDLVREQSFAFKIIEYLFSFSRLNIPYNHKELIIAELSIIIILNSII